MQLDSYQKASADVLKYIKKDPTIFVINSLDFRTLITIAKKKNDIPFDCYEHISILDILPNVYAEIEECLPFPNKEELNQIHFATELVSSYGVFWTPILSKDYQLTESSFCESINMVTWQRYLRASKSKDMRELTVLSIDPNRKVRDLAKKRLKTIKK